MVKLVTRIFASIFLVFSLYCYSNILYIDNAYKQMNSGRYEQKLFDRIFTGMVYYAPAERIAVDLYNKQLDTNSINYRLVSFYADQLLQANNRSSQAYYFKGVVQEASGNLPGAINSMEKAVEYDIYNTVYLRGLTLLKIKYGDIQSAETIIRKIEAFNPQETILIELKEALVNAKQTLP